MISELNSADSANPETVHDAALVRRFNAGDESAFVEIVTRHRGKMFSIALGHLRNHADAEEIAQDTFVRAYRGLARFRGDSSLAGWLYRIVFNLSRNRYGYYFRRHSRDTCSFDCALNDGTSATYGDLVASDAPNPVREASNREFIAHVAACMAKLNARQREILLLRNQRHQSYVKIGRTLGLRIGTVKSRIARARKNLRGLLARAYGEFESDNPSSASQWFESSRPVSHLRISGSSG